MGPFWSKIPKHGYIFYSKHGLGSRGPGGTPPSKPKSSTPPDIYRFLSKRYHIYSIITKRCIGKIFSKNIIFRHIAIARITFLFLSLMHASKAILNLPTSSLHLCSPFQQNRKVKIHHQFTSFLKTIVSRFTTAKIKLGKDSPSWFIYFRSRFTFK